jgi:hypothetical protein
VRDRVPVLRDQQDALVVVEGDDAHRAGVDDDVADELDSVCR